MTADDALAVDAPDVVRRDEAFTTRVTGLASGERVTLTAETDDDTPWSSQATFEADDEGVVDLAETAPVAGDYDRADAMGLVWSLTPPDTDDPDRRYRQAPTEAHRLELAAETDATRATTTVTVRHSAPGVERHDTPADGPYGAWFEPPGDGPHPPVFVLHGSGGTLLDETAGLLASEGYAAYALRWLDAGDLPAYPSGVPLEYVSDAVDWFLANDAVCEGGYGVYGGSMGAQLAYVLASRDERVDAVVADAGNPVVFHGGEGTAWTEDGEDLQGIGVPDGHPPDAWDHAVDGHPDAVDRHELFLQMLQREDTAARREATLAVEHAGAAILALAGCDDHQWPAATFDAMLCARLDAVQYVAPVDTRLYHEAGHVVGVPYAPTSWRPARGAGLGSGGDPAAHAAAQADAWPRVLDWFADALATGE
jgi:dienelactone hydrolase